MELYTYRNLSNFKVNQQKSEALNVALTSQALINLSCNLPFRWAPQTIQYLGTKIPSEVKLSSFTILS